MELCNCSIVMIQWDFSLQYLVMIQWDFFLNTCLSYWLPESAHVQEPVIRLALGR